MEKLSWTGLSCSPPAVRPSLRPSGAVSPPPGVDPDLLPHRPLSSDSGGALLPDCRQEAGSLSDVFPSADPLPAPLEHSHLQRGPAAGSAAVSFLSTLIWFFMTRCHVRVHACAQQSVTGLNSCLPVGPVTLVSSSLSACWLAVSTCSCR